MSPEWATIIAAVAAIIGGAITKIADLFSTNKTVEAAVEKTELEYLSNERTLLISELKEEREALRVEIADLRSENAKLRQLLDQASIRIASLEKVVAKLHPDDTGRIELS